ncbi:MAG: hypothetical protein WCT77_11795, partial [Bacteroidota bacterium]
MKKALLFSLIIFIVFAIPANSQLRNQWELCDSIPNSTIVYNGNEYYSEYSLIDIKYSKDGGISLLSKRPLLTHYEYLIRNSSDSGTTWKTVFIDSTKKLNYSKNEINLLGITQVSKNNIILNGYLSFQDTTVVNGKQKINISNKGIIMYSNDLCKTWKKIIFDTNSCIQNVSMTDSMNGIAMKTPLGIGENKDTILITKDGWNSYEKVEILENMYSNRISQISYIKPNIILVLNYNTNTQVFSLFRRKEDAKTWEDITLPLPIGRVRKFKFIDKMHGFLIYEGYFFKTTDGGMNWVKFETIDGYPADNGAFSDFDFADENQGVLINGASIYFTQNSGTDLITESFQLPNRLMLYTINPFVDKAFVCLTNGMIYKRTKNQIFKTPRMYLQDYISRYIKPNGVNVSWEKIDGAENYQLKVYEASIYYNPSNTFSLYKDTITNSTNLKSDYNYNCRYYYQIRAYNNAMSSEFSGLQESVTTIWDSNSITSPLILYPFSGGKNYFPTKLTVRWTNDTPADYYDIKISKSFLDDSPRYLLKTYENYTDTSLYVDFLSPDTLYYFAIRCNINGKNSDWSFVGFLTYPYITSVLEETNHTKQIINIFPNPALNQSRGVINNVFENIKEIRLYNSLGIEIKNFKFKSNNTDTGNQ